MRKQANIHKKEYKSLDRLDYEILEDDVKFLSGPYAGDLLSELWLKGPNERDWVVNKLWSKNDVQVNEIIKKLACT